MIAIAHAALLLRPPQQHRGEEDVREGEFEEDFPAQRHQLVKAKAGKSPADDDEEEDEGEHLREEGGDVQQAEPPGCVSGFKGQAEIRRKRNAPAAEEEGDGHAGADDHGGILTHEEEGEFHRAVLGVITGDELRFALREVEGEAVCLGEHGDGEDAKADDNGDEQHPALEAEALAPEG